MARVCHFIDAALGNGLAKTGYGKRVLDSYDFKDLIDHKCVCPCEEFVG